MPTSEGFRIIGNMTSQNLSKYKNILEAEKTLLTQELGSVGRINPDNKNDWEPIKADGNIDQAEMEERATEITDFEDRSAVEFTLEERLKKINAALARISEDAYGACKVCKNPIEDARLDANPAAETCKAHIE